MSERLTTILGYATLVAILAAVWVLFGEDPSLRQGARGERLFDGLQTRVNTAARLTLSQSDRHVTLVRDGTHWTVAERDGYEADPVRVRDLLRGLALSERREPMTANRDRFDALGLDNASAIALTLADDADASLADLSVGTRKEGGAGRSLTYVYRDGDSRAWLVSSLPEISADPVNWLDTTLLSLDADRIASVRLGNVTLDRDADAGEYNLTDLGDDETQAPAWKRRDPARVLARLTLTDARRLANPITDPVRTVIVTVDVPKSSQQAETAQAGGSAEGGDIAGAEDASGAGTLALTLKLFDMEEGNWVQLAAAGASAEAGLISARTDGWLYKLSEGDAAVLMRARADFLEAVQGTDESDQN